MLSKDNLNIFKNLHYKIITNKLYKKLHNKYSLNLTQLTIKLITKTYNN